MPDQDTFPMTPLDQMLTSESLQIIKAAVPYAPPHIQQILSVCAKLQELKTALTLFPRSESLQAMSADPPKVSAADMLSEISRFAVGSSRDSMESLSRALNTVQILQTMQTEESPDGCPAEPTEETGEKGDE